MKKLHFFIIGGTLATITLCYLILGLSIDVNNASAKQYPITNVTPQTGGVVWNKGDNVQVSWNSQNFQGFPAVISLVAATSSTGTPPVLDPHSGIPLKFTLKSRFTLAKPLTDQAAMATDTIISPDYNLKHLALQFNNVNLGLPDDTSGIAYAPTTNTYFTVHNKENTISEVDINGKPLHYIICSGCGDIESITYVTSTPKMDNGKRYLSFMIGTEDYASNERMFRVLIPSFGDGTVVNANAYFNTGIQGGDNKGLEGLAYNPADDTYFASIEEAPKLYKVSVGKNHSASSKAICNNLNLSSVVGDISDLTLVGNTLFVLSQESRRLIPIDVTDTTHCTFVDENGDGKGNVNDWLNNVPLDQPEGVTWGANGAYLLLVGEPHNMSRYISTNKVAAAPTPTLAAGLPDYRFNVTIPTSVPDGLYNVTIDVSPNDYYSTGVSTFPVDIEGSDANATTALPYVHITSIASTTVWSKSANHTVKWTKGGAPAVQFGLFMVNPLNGKTFTLRDFVPNTGSALVTPSEMANVPAGNYEFHISAETDGGAYRIRDISPVFKLTK